METLPKTYNPKDHEEKIYRLWEKGGYFKPRKNTNGKKFVVWMAPPNITGSLHMGHALENTLLDVIVRKRRMEGFETLWVPGTDHAGIGTQNVVEKELKKEGLTRFDLGREKFEKRVWEWREKYGGLILEQFRKLGVSPDWSRLSFTLDPGYSRAVFTAFSAYHKAGWIYRARKVVNWCPRCATVISDLEVEHKEEHGKLWYIKYPIAKNPKSKILNPKQIQKSKSEIQNSDCIVVATTRPETMLGDAAVAVNPKDERYKPIIGKIAVLPIQNREIPIVADAVVDPKFGTGAVKVTPAHDTADYEISQRHGLPLIQVIDECGRMTEEAGPEFSGLKTKEAREKVVTMLAELGKLEKIEDYTVSIGICERCGTKIEPIPSWQWFLKMKTLAGLGINPIRQKKVNLVPIKWKKPYLEWLKNVRDWPISRQLWWGHRLPVWFCENQTGRIPSENWELKIENFVVSLKHPKICPFCKRCEMEQSQDVLDTWFSSALWPLATLGWPASAKATAGKPKKTKDLERYYPGDLISSAPEILYLWIARMVFSGMYFMGKPPFATEYVHATVLTKEGRRMSKSLGTGIDPLDLIAKYGADATRFGLIWQATGTQAIHLDEGAIENGKKFANKLWNASRFVMMKIGSKANTIPAKPPARNLSAEDRTLIEALKKTAKSYEKDIESYRFGQAAQTLYHFVWHTFCDGYIEYSKKETRKEVDEILLWTLSTCLKLLHPMVPYVTESIWQHIFGSRAKPLIIQEWPS